MIALSNPSVSVIVPVFGIAEGLECCLAALEHQSYPKPRYEVVVVDNGSTSDLRSIVGGAPQARLEHESEPGSYAARNRGILVTRGEILAFTDSDCIPAPDWIERGAAQLRGHPDCGFVAGRVNLFFHDPAHPTAAELYDFAVLNFRQDRNVEMRKFGATANLFVFRRVFDSIGFFNARLLSGGDLEWGQRVYAQGLAQIYDAEACVDHPARRSWQDTFRRTTRLVGGQFRLQVESGASVRQLCGELVRHFVPAISFYWRILRDRRVRRPQHRVRVVLVALGMQYVGAIEMLRLMLGGRANR